jgi:hypothetical protein
MFRVFAGFLGVRDTWEMRLVTRTESMTAVEIRTAKSTTRARRSRSTDCRCGQQLDMCARAHCPRCGRSISQA